VKIGDYIPPGRQVNRLRKCFAVAARATKTVLIVEDDAIVAEIYSLALGRAGYRVMVSRNGVDGLEAAAREQPDFIFLDIRMPKMDGIEVLRGLAGRGEGIVVPIVMLTNFDDPAIDRVLPSAPRATSSKPARTRPIWPTSCPGGLASRSRLDRGSQSSRPSCWIRNAITNASSRQDS